MYISSEWNRYSLFFLFIEKCALNSSIKPSLQYQCLFIIVKIKYYPFAYNGFHGLSHQAQFLDLLPMNRMVQFYRNSWNSSNIIISVPLPMLFPCNKCLKCQLLPHCIDFMTQDMVKNHSLKKI